MRIKLNIEIDADLPRDSDELARVVSGIAGLTSLAETERTRPEPSLDDYLVDDASTRPAAIFPDSVLEDIRRLTEEEEPPVAPVADAPVAEPAPEPEQPALTGEVIDDKTEAAHALLAEAGLKRTSSTSLPSGARIKEGDSVKIKGETFVVLATARGRAAIISEEGAVTLVPTDALDDDAATPAASAVSGEADPHMTQVYDSSALQAAAGDSSVTLADLRVLGKKVQDHIGVDAVMTAIRVSVPTANRLGDVPESSYPSVAAEFKAKLAKVGQAT